MPKLWKNSHHILAIGLTIWLSLSFLIILGILLLVLYFGRFLRSELTTFFNAAQASPVELLTLAGVGWHRTPVQTESRKNILILGVDSLSTRGDAPALTDTIMLVSLNLNSGQAQAVSLPRDIYISSLQTRINSLYWYGTQENPSDPKRLPSTTISELTGVPIHHTVVVTLEDLGALIDLLGGVTINVPSAFVDDMFPRTDVDVTVERDPAKLYETISFEAGEQTFDGQTALKYIRSRHGEGTEGNDLARSRRQQQVMTALLKNLTNLQRYKDPETAGKLVNFYQAKFADHFSTTELVATLRQLLPYRNQITFSGSSVSVYPEDPEGVLFHPPLSAYEGQWLYVIRDEAAFQTEIQTKLNLLPSEPTSNE